MSVTSVQLWDGIYHLGADDLIADSVPLAVIAKLIEFEMVELDAVGLPQLTPYGEKCFAVLNTGNGTVPELNAMAAVEAKKQDRGTD